MKSVGSPRIAARLDAADGMTTNRTPIARRSTAMITPVALDAFRRLVALESECVGPPECEPYTSGVPPAMSGGGCNGLIHRELALKPWEFRG